MPQTATANRPTASDPYSPTVQLPGAVAPFDAEPFFEKYPKARKHALHREKMDAVYDGGRAACSIQVRRVTAEIQKVHESYVSFSQHDMDRTQKIKGKDTSHRAEHNRKVKSLQAKAMEFTLDMKKYPRNRINEIYEAVIKAHRAGQNFRQLEMKDYATDMPLDDARQLHAPLEKELADIQNADCSDEDAIANVKAWISAAKESVQFNMDRFCAGGMYNHRGDFTLTTPVPDFRLPTSVALTHAADDGHAHALEIPDPMALMLALDTDNALEQRFIALMLESNKGKRKIAMKDKPELIRVQKAKILEAARTLEFCCVREELKGTMVKRPHDCEWTTMLWLEPVDKLHVVEPEEEINFG